MLTFSKKTILITAAHVLIAGVAGVRVRADIAEVAEHGENVNFDDWSESIYGKYADEAREIIIQGAMNNNGLTREQVIQMLTNQLPNPQSEENTSGIISGSQVYVRQPEDLLEIVNKIIDSMGSIRAGGFIDFHADEATRTTQKNKQLREYADQITDKLEEICGSWKSHKLSRVTRYDFNFAILEPSLGLSPDNSGEQEVYAFGFQFFVDHEWRHLASEKVTIRGKQELVMNAQDVVDFKMELRNSIDTIRIESSWRNLKKIGNRNFEHFGALRAFATPKMMSNYMSIEIRTPNFVPDLFLFFWYAKIFQKKWCGLLLGLQNL